MTSTTAGLEGINRLMEHPILGLAIIIIGQSFAFYMAHRNNKPD